MPLEKGGIDVSRERKGRVESRLGGGWEVRVDRKMKMGKLKMAANRYGVSY